MPNLYVVQAVAWVADAEDHIAPLWEGVGVPVAAFTDRAAAEAWADVKSAERLFDAADGWLSALAWSLDELTHLEPTAFREWLVEQGVPWPTGERWTAVRVPRELSLDRVAKVVRALKTPFFTVAEVPLVGGGVG